ncbi:MAG: hypothetical protein FIA82_10100, partial [Melioribacter sp.]|nr:hypothetical protein [Melioribacter sp.]
MKFTKLIKFIMLFSFTISYAQTNFENYYNNLFYTCKVWGYLKYFHISLAEGKINWDDFLLSNLPKLKTVTTKDEFNNYLALYFNLVGSMQTSTETLPIVPEDLRYNLKTEWFINNSFSSTTTGILQDIQNKFRPRINYYVQAHPDGNPTFNYDRLFYNNTNTTEELRLLSLFRYWNVINYFFPYKNILDKNWDDVLKEIIPKIINSADEISYHKTILEMAAHTNDAHADLTTSGVITWNIRGYYIIPVTLKYLNGKTIILKTGSGVSNLKPGDIIKKINGVSTEELRSNFRPITCGSNPASLERNINSYLISFIENKPVTLEIENEKGVSQVSLSLTTLTNYWNYFSNSEPAWTIKNKDGKKFGIINLDILKDSQIQTMFDELWETDALIFDIRGYPNVTIQYLLNYLFPGPIIIARFTKPDVTYPGTFVWSSSPQGEGEFSKNYTKRIYILLNEDSQSASEYDIMALEQHPMAVKVGSQTAGADGNTSDLFLPGKIDVCFTGLGTFYPDHRPTQRIGIVPDIHVLPTIQGIRDGNDEVLDAAINHYFGITDVKQENKIPVNYSLSQNYPNPFNPSTAISYRLSTFCKVTLKVFDVLGRDVATLVNENKSAGSYSVEFNAFNLSS